MDRVKITVVKKLNNDDLFGSTPPAECTLEAECPAVKLGQEFIVEELPKCPADFCAWAFSDIYRDVVHLSLGGNFPWIKEPGVILSCCTDGCRPVIFKLERLED